MRKSRKYTWHTAVGTVLPQPPSECLCLYSTLPPWVCIEGKVQRGTNPRTVRSLQPGTQNICCQHQSLAKQGLPGPFVHCCVSRDWPAAKCELCKYMWWTSKPETKPLPLSQGGKGDWRTAFVWCVFMNPSVLSLTSLAGWELRHSGYSGTQVLDEALAAYGSCWSNLRKRDVPWGRVGVTGVVPRRPPGTVSLAAFHRKAQAVLLGFQHELFWTLWPPEFGSFPVLPNTWLIPQVLPNLVGYLICTSPHTMWKSPDPVLNLGPGTGSQRSTLKMLSTLNQLLIFLKHVLINNPEEKFYV